MDKSVRFECQTFSGFNTPKSLKSVKSWQSYVKIKNWTFWGTRCIKKITERMKSWYRNPTSVFWSRRRIGFVGSLWLTRTVSSIWPASGTVLRCENTDITPITLDRNTAPMMVIESVSRSAVLRWASCSRWRSARRWLCGCLAFLSFRSSAWSTSSRPSARYSST